MKKINRALNTIMNTVVAFFLCRSVFYIWDYLTNPEITAKIDKYSSEVKEILDEDWRNNLWMTIFPLEGEYYIDYRFGCFFRYMQGRRLQWVQCRCVAGAYVCCEFE